MSDASPGSMKRFGEGLTAYALGLPGDAAASPPRRTLTATSAGSAPYDPSPRRAVATPARHPSASAMSGSAASVPALPPRVSGLVAHALSRGPSSPSPTQPYAPATPPATYPSGASASRYAELTHPPWAAPTQREASASPREPGALERIAARTDPRYAHHTAASISHMVPHVASAAAAVHADQRTHARERAYVDPAPAHPSPQRSYVTGGGVVSPSSLRPKAPTTPEPSPSRSRAAVAVAHAEAVSRAAARPVHAAASGTVLSPPMVRSGSPLRPVHDKASPSNVRAALAAVQAEALARRTVTPPRREASAPRISPVRTRDTTATVPSPTANKVLDGLGGLLWSLEARAKRSAQYEAEAVALQKELKERDADDAAAAGKLETAFQALDVSTRELFSLRSEVARLRVIAPSLELRLKVCQEERDVLRRQLHEARAQNQMLIEELARVRDGQASPAKAAPVPANAVVESEDDLPSAPQYTSAKPARAAREGEAGQVAPTPRREAPAAGVPVRSETAAAAVEAAPTVVPRAGPEPCANNDDAAPQPLAAAFENAYHAQAVLRLASEAGSGEGAGARAAAATPYAAANTAAVSEEEQRQRAVPVEKTDGADTTRESPGRNRSNTMPQHLEQSTACSYQEAFEGAPYAIAMMSAALEERAVPEPAPTHVPEPFRPGKVAAEEMKPDTPAPPSIRIPFDEVFSSDEVPHAHAMLRSLEDGWRVTPVQRPAAAATPPPASPAQLPSCDKQPHDTGDKRVPLEDVFPAYATCVLRLADNDTAPKAAKPSATALALQLPATLHQLVVADDTINSTPDVAAIDSDLGLTVLRVHSPRSKCNSLQLLENVLAGSGEGLRRVGSTGDGEVVYGIGEVREGEELTMADIDAAAEASPAPLQASETTNEEAPAPEVALRTPAAAAPQATTPAVACGGVEVETSDGTHALDDVFPPYAAKVLALAEEPRAAPPAAAPVAAEAGKAANEVDGAHGDRVTLDEVFPSYAAGVLAMADEPRSPKATLEPQDPPTAAAAAAAAPVKKQAKVVRIATPAEEEMNADPNNPKHKPWMGMRVRTDVPHKALVTDVAKGGPADVAGLGDDDVLTSFGGERVSTFATFVAAYKRTAAVGRALPVTVLHNGVEGDERSFVITMGSQHDREQMELNWVEGAENPTAEEVRGRGAVTCDAPASKDDGRQTLEEVFPSYAAKVLALAGAEPVGEDGTAEAPAAAAEEERVALDDVFPAYAAKVLALVDEPRSPDAGSAPPKPLRANGAAAGVACVPLLPIAAANGGGAAGSPSATPASVGAPASAKSTPMTLELPATLHQLVVADDTINATPGAAEGDAAGDLGLTVLRVHSPRSKCNSLRLLENVLAGSGEGLRRVGSTGDGEVVYGIGEVREGEELTMADIEADAARQTAVGVLRTESPRAARVAHGSFVGLKLIEKMLQAPEGRE